MEIQVKIEQILQARTFVSSRDNTQRVVHSFVGVTLDEQFPRKICFNVNGDEHFKAMNIAVGNVYSISFNIESREWNGKWYTNINAWRVASINANNSVATSPTAHQQPQAQNSTNGTINSMAASSAVQCQQQSDDLPF